MEILSEENPSMNAQDIQDNHDDKIYNNYNDNDNDKDNDVDNGNDRNDEIESIPFTCTWALNYELPARDIYGENNNDDEILLSTETSPLLQTLSTKRTYADTMLDEDDDVDCGKNKMSKSKMWTSKEDAILIREYKNNPDNFVNAAMEHLPGKSEISIWLYWNEHLSRYHSSDTTMGTYKKKWTPEEDAIIIREYENDPNNYTAAAMEYLPDRTRGPINTRWNEHLKKSHSSSDTTTRICKKWTPEEDAIIIREYENDPNIYIDTAMEYLPDRTRRAINARWYSLQNRSHFSSDTTIRIHKKWTPEEDAIIIREYENNPNNYLDAAMEYLPCLLYTSPSPRDLSTSRMPSSA